MTFPSLAGLIGFFLAAILHGILLSTVRKRQCRGQLERLLTLLLSGLVLWYSGLFLASILRQMDPGRVGFLLAASDALAFSALSFLPALLLHTHWAYYRRHFQPSRLERSIVRAALFLLYGGLVVLPVAIGQLLSEISVNPLAKLGPFRAPFLAVLGLSYVISAVLQWKIVRRSNRQVERSLFKRLIVLFLVIPAYTFWVFELAAPQQAWYPFQVNLAFLGSVLPSLVVSYYIYRHQFLQFSVYRGFSNALLIVAIMTVYLVVIRKFGNYLEHELKTPPVLLEGIFVVGLLLIFPPLSQWLNDRLSRSFSEDIERFRRVAGLIRSGSFQLTSIEELRAEIESLLKNEFPEIEARIAFANDSASIGEFVTIPLSREKEIGYLQLIRPENPTAGQREGLHILAHEIANSLERSRMLQVQLSLEREVARKSRMEELGQMAATVAHNVKNPLSSIRTLLQLQREANNLTDEQQSELGMMIEEVDRLARTVTSLLRFSRLENLESAPSVAKVNLDSLIQSVASVYRGMVESGDLRLETVCSRTPPWIATNQESLQEILGNLLWNAVEASPPGGLIRVTVQGSPDQAEFTIEDDGPGIPGHLISKIFEPFFTTKAAGTGLGLAIVKRRVEQLGGSIQMERGTRTGTIVRLAIPDARESSEGASQGVNNNAKRH